MFTSINDVISRITRAAEQGVLTLLVGAGISRPTPSSLPTVRDYITDLYTSIKDDLPTSIARHLDGEYLELLIQRPFEMLMSQLAQGVDKGLLDLLHPLRGGEPNQLHYFIADLLKSGAARRVITTNFDNLIEKALNKDICRISVVLDPNKDCTTHRRDPLLYKAHGSFLDPSGNDVSASILTTVESIGRSFYDSEKIRSLASLFEDQVILVCGYSGNDRIDMLPALRMSKPQSILWLDHSESPVRVASLLESQQHLAEVISRNGVFLRGNTQRFCDMVGRCLGVVAPSERAQASTQLLPRVSLPRHLLTGRGAFLAGFWFLAMGPNEQSIAKQCFSHFLDNTDANVPEILKARALVGFAQALEFLGELEEAKQNYRAALQLYEAMGNIRGSAITFNDLGLCYAEMYDYDAAFSHIKKSLSLGEVLNDAEIECVSWHNLGVVSEHQGERRSTEEYYTKAINAGRKSGNLVRLALGLGNLIVNRAQWDARKLINIEALNNEIELLELYSMTGMDAAAKIGRHQGLCVWMFSQIYGDRAMETLRGHPVLRRIGMSNTMVDLLTEIG